MTQSQGPAAGHDRSFPAAVPAAPPPMPLRRGASVLFVEPGDPANWPVHATLQQRGHDVAWIGLPSEEPAGLAFAPDMAILDPAATRGNGHALLQRFAESGRHCPILLVDTAPHLLGEARAAAAAAGISILGRVDRPYAADAITHAIGRVRAAPRDSEACDRLLVSWLIQQGRLLPNLTHEFLPKLSLETNRVAGYETLTRLRNRRALNPELIFAASTILSLEARATLLAIEASLKMAAALRRDGRPVPIAANCSAAVLANADFINDLSLMLHRLSPPPGALMIELTEDPRQAKDAVLIGHMHILIARGITFSIDDFGKGAANFDRIAGLPVAELKIDRLMFRAAAEGRFPMPLLTELVRYCRNAAIEVVVEGIESEEDLALARTIGAGFGQGFHWGRPMSPRAITPWFEG